MSKSDAPRVGVFGASGSGKSTWAQRYIKQRKRVVVFDPQGEFYNPNTRAATGVQTVVHSLNEVNNAMIANYHGFKVAYVPPSGAEEEYLSRLSFLVQKCQQPYFGDPPDAQYATLMVEEMSLSFINGRDERCPGFKHLCNMGRHYWIELVGVSQRFAQVSTTFRGNLSDTIVFRQNGGPDIAAALYWVGKANKDSLARLGKLEFLHVKQGEVTPGKISF